MDDATREGQRLTADDIKERLIQKGDPKTLLVWPPNLFAYTSYLLSLSGAYQLAVSPPREASWPESWSAWPPSKELLDELLEHVSDTKLRAEAKARVARAAEIEKWMNDESVAVPPDRRERLWTYLVRECGQEWRGALPSDEKAIRAAAQQPDDALPIFLRACWSAFQKLSASGWDVAFLLCNCELVGYEDEKPPHLLERWLASVALLSMHAIADETCVSWGVLDGDGLTVCFPDDDSLAEVHRAIAAPDGETAALFRDTFMKNASPKKSAAQRWAEEWLHIHGTLGTIHPYRGRVLPKRHTPDVGITLRSISSNLSFHRSAIEVVWNRETSEAGKRSPLSERMQIHDDKPDDEKTITILLLPLPLEIRSKAFDPWKKGRPVATLSPYDFFTYTPPPAGEMLETISRALARAQEEVDTVDMVVLPEAAFHSDVLYDVEARLLPGRVPVDPVSFYVAGVAEDAVGKAFPGENAVYFKSITRAGKPRFLNNDELQAKHVEYRQYKHHRWQLNRPQLLQYGLTHKLTEQTKWWEAINVGKRRVTFINIGERLTVCPLICEDLARQDPIADLIRHVGPSLVITILMDGPQLRDRWASRYAGILSEDPGSAVIALTSYGMVRRWSASYRPLSHIVALWTDQTGPRELELEQGACGILLSVRVTAKREPIADGRLELHGTSRLDLIDVIQIQA
jgi:hypothetical protein